MVEVTQVTKLAKQGDHHKNTNSKDKETDEVSMNKYPRLTTRIKIPKDSPAILCHAEKSPTRVWA